MNILYPIDLNKNEDLVLTSLIHDFPGDSVTIVLLKTYKVDQVEGRCVIETNDMFKLRLQKELNQFKSHLLNTLPAKVTLTTVLKIGSLKHVLPQMIGNSEFDYLYVNDCLIKPKDYGHSIIAL